MSKLDVSEVSKSVTVSNLSAPNIEKFLESNKVDIEKWLEHQLNLTPPPIYCSVDIRNAGVKMSPVDTNLFPAGFNNLGIDSQLPCAQAFKKTIQDYDPGIKKILLIPEDHTRNIYYFENIATIKRIIEKAGFEVRIGTLASDMKEARSIDLPSGNQIVLDTIVREGSKVKCANFVPDLILLNNDLSTGIPAALQNIDQLVMPPLSAGWHSRLKSQHFQHYQQVATEFGKTFNIDPWFIAPLFRYCGKVNFMAAKHGEHCLIKRADELLNDIRERYKKYGIQHQPYLVVKADAGTYGMAVLMIKDSQELLTLNRKDRTRMASIKGGREVTQVIIQEGVHTLETRGNESVTAEPVIYMIGKEVVGGFYRIHAGKGFDENLNTPGMFFEPLSATTELEKQQFYAYGVISRLALIAAGRELHQAKFQE